MSLIAIDGRAGAGKTTLAARFFDELSVDKTVAVIHMDDLYDGWENALDERLTQSLESIVKSAVDFNVPPCKTILPAVAEPGTAPKFLSELILIVPDLAVVVPV